MGSLDSCTSVCLCSLFTTPKTYMDNIPKMKGYVEISKGNCELSALFWNRCCLLKLLSISQALSLAQATRTHVRIRRILKFVFKATWYLLFLYLDGMLLIPSIILVEWTGTHFDMFWQWRNQPHSWVCPCFSMKVLDKYCETESILILGSGNERVHPEFPY